MGLKLITVSIDFPFPISPLSFCQGALSQRREIMQWTAEEMELQEDERTKV